MLSRAWPVLFLAALPCARAFGLRVVQGPSDIVGLEPAAVPFAFSARDFDVSGPAVLFREAEWTSDCPPRYAGAASLAGAVVVSADGILSALCSFEQRALGAQRAGAAAWVAALRAGSYEHSLDPVPGYAENVWLAGDSRELTGIVAADARGRTSDAIVGALDAGDVLLLQLTPSPSRYASVASSRGFLFWRVVIVLHCAAVLELALCRSYAFVRADGGLRATRQQMLLWLEVGACALRVAYFGGDPLEGSGLFNFETALTLSSVHLSAGAVSMAIFIVLFCEAVSAAGIVPFRLANPGWRSAFLLGAVCVLLVDIVLGSLAVRIGLRWLVVAKLAGALLLEPLTLIAVAASCYTRTRAGLARSRLSSGHVARWLRRLFQSAVYWALALACGIVLPWALYGPVRQVVVHALWVHALNSASYVHIDAVRPLYERSPRGPFRMLHDAFFACISLLAEPSAPSLDESRLAAKANIQPAPELRARSTRATAKRATAVSSTAITPDKGVSAADGLSKATGPSSGRASALDAAAAANARTSPWGSIFNTHSARTRCTSGGDCAIDAQPAQRASSSGGGAIAAFLRRSSVAPAPAPIAPAAGGGGGADAAGGGGGSAAAQKRATMFALRAPKALRSSGASAGGVEAPDASSSAQLSPTMRAASSATRGIARDSVRGSVASMARDSVRGSVASGTGAHASSMASAVVEVGAKPPDSMLLGISIYALRAFIAENSLDARAQTHEVQSLLRKMTAGTQRSYAEVHHVPTARTSVNGGQPVGALRPAPPPLADGRAARIGRATLLVVHAHLRSFLKLVDALEAHIEVHALDPAVTFFWIDCFCVRALDALDVAQEMGAVARAIGSVLLVLEPWNRPVCLRRSWCLYELQRAKAAGVKVHATVTTQGRADMREDVQNDASGASGLIDAFIAMVDVRSSYTSVEKDKQMLLGLVRSHMPDASGEEALNRLNADVRQVVRAAVEALIRVAQHEPMTKLQASRAVPRARGMSVEQAEAMRLSTMAELEREVYARMSALQAATDAAQVGLRAARISTSGRSAEARCSGAGATPAPSPPLGSNRNTD
ncbi:hypothetical protein KFE25_010880 [Diacronema lutheri]|uniref:RGS domain-containing protein n=1 Tax=Diacronema lutheri TaxID=2081491 RepID=A0A8J5XL41_DIALT|nr:hypothetical protein KFE25_010880 [Diacronema lutheri]